MKKICTFLFTALFFNASSFAQLNFERETAFVPGEVLVQLKKGQSPHELVKQFPEYFNLTVAKELSKPMRIWQLNFDHNIISHEELLKKLYGHHGVRIAQNNHFVEERATMPNDPNIGSQWHHVNGNDADIDSDLAWDLTTGGLTAFGDTIVICLVEGGGALFSHPDLAANFWRNHQEIPNNSIDDDGNGYVDDYEGWNVNGNNDNHGTGNHGTQCMGMMAAKGNNNVGVAGANWDVKVMLVSGFNTSESSVISAYSYPLEMRKLYDQTNGAQGAFVVATSASWGIDNADPDNYPLWCAFYDTLGVYGVLNPGATTNNNTNVDVAGDMPTACASDYMISVTRTGNTDNQAGGYGATTIDFGAPGINVYTTSGTNSYTTTTGTSFSCPLTAGVIALLYSLPCNSFMTTVKADPQAGADLVLDALMNGVDVTAAMTGISVTNGRLNANGSVTYLMNNCGAGSCAAAYNLNASSVTDTSATLGWSDPNGATDFWYYIRPVGAPAWDSALVSGSNSVNVSGLLGCTDYEFRLVTYCNPDTSNFSFVETFTTDGCCIYPSSVSASSPTSSGATISWDAVVAANTYNIQYRAVGSSTWIPQSSVTNPYTISGLTNCTTYEVQVATVCDTGTTAYGPSAYFSTTGCGVCENAAYCASQGTNVINEWIAGVEFNTINNFTDADAGYLYSGMNTTIVAGSSYGITLTPGYATSALDEHFVVWIDYNQDGVFADPSEIAYNSGGNVNAAVSGTVNVPITASPGTTRMRVTMKYVGGTSTTQPVPCTSPQYGEVEDYCVTIDTTGMVVNEITDGYVVYTVYPNPAYDQLNLQLFNFNQLPSGIHKLELINSVGQRVKSININSKSTSFPVSDLSNGVYFYRLQLSNGVQRSGKIVIQK